MRDRRIGAELRVRNHAISTSVIVMYNAIEMPSDSRIARGKSAAGFRFLGGRGQHVVAEHGENTTAAAVTTPGQPKWPTPCASIVRSGTNGCQFVGLT